MNKPASPSRPPAFDALEFEVTDFGEARQALEELPPGVAELAKRSASWAERRRPPQPSDRALTGAAVDWVMSLPQDLRPQKLCMQFPRVANAIAQTWQEPSAARAAIVDLLVDRRGGRRGLPEPVQAELRALIGELQRSARSGGAGGSLLNDEIARARLVLEAAGYRVIPPGG